MKSIIISIFGVYEPISYTVSDSTVIPSGLAGVDIAWCTGAVIFIVFMYCIFRILGGRK